jgi:hypothetical protein
MGTSVTMSSSQGWIPEQSIAITLTLCPASHEHHPLGPGPTRSGRHEPGITAYPASLPLCGSRHYGKKISGRKTFGLHLGQRGRNRGGAPRSQTLWASLQHLGDGGFKKTFIAECRTHHISAEVVNRIHPGRFEVLPRRWVVERNVLADEQPPVPGRLRARPQGHRRLRLGGRLPPTPASTDPTGDRVIALGK